MAYLIPGQRRDPLPPAYSQAPSATTTTTPSNTTQPPTDTSTTVTSPQSSDAQQTQSQPQLPAPVHARFLDHDDLNLDHDPERAEPPPAYTPSRPARVRAMFIHDPIASHIYNHHNRVEMTMDMYKTQRARRRWYAAGALLSMIVILAIVASNLSRRLNDDDN